MLRYAGFVGKSNNMKRRNKQPLKSNAYKLDEAEFNLEYVAKQGLQEFQEANAHQWPEIPEADRNSKLAMVHGKAVTKLAEDGHNTGNASTLPRTESGTDAGERSSEGDNSGSGSEPGSTVSAGGKIGRKSA